MTNWGKMLKRAQGKITALTSENIGLKKQLSDERREKEALANRVVDLQVRATDEGDTRVYNELDDALNKDSEPMPQSVVNAKAKRRK